MARIRTIKPEFWQDEKLSPCDPLTRLVFLGLVSLADDAGRLVDNLRLIDAQIFPNTSDTAHEALMRLSGMGRIKRGKTASGQRIIEICNWSKHQKIQHPNLKGSLPQIVEEWAVTEIHEPLMNASGAAHEPLTHHTNDQNQRPTTRDHRSAPQKARRFPDFSDANRARVIAAFRKVGVYSPEVIVSKFGPAFRPAGDPQWIDHAHVVLGIEDYCGVIGAGRSGPFVSPDDCLKRIALLAKNAAQNAHDPEKRWEGAMVAVHGTSKVAA